MARGHKINASAKEKMNESRFFLTLMEKAVEDDAFVYFLSAFLSALCSAIEPIKLQPRKAIDARYKAWKKEMDEGPLNDGTLLLLREMRNGEVHKIPTGKLQSIGASFPEGLDLSRGGYVEIDFSQGKPIGRHKVGLDGPVETHPITVSWHFDAPSDPDVLATCRAGLAIVERVIASRSAMRFDSEEAPNSQGVKTEMDQTEFVNKCAFGNTMYLPGKLEPYPDMKHGVEPFRIKSFQIAGGVFSTASKGSKGVHIRLHLTDYPDRFIVLDLEAFDAQRIGEALTREGSK